MVQIGSATMIGGGGGGGHDHHSRNPSQLSVAVSEAIGSCGGGGGLMAVTTDDCSKVPPTDDGEQQQIGGDGRLHGDDGDVQVIMDGGCGDAGDMQVVVVDEKTADHQRIGCGPVTIVQTTPAANVPGTVIVTVSSANNDATNVRCRENEMEILAHL